MAANCLSLLLSISLTLLTALLLLNPISTSFAVRPDDVSVALLHKPFLLSVLHLADLQEEQAHEISDTTKVDCSTAFAHSRSTTNLTVSSAQARLGLVDVNSICSPLRPTNASRSEIALDRLRQDAFRISYLQSKKLGRPPAPLAGESKPVTTPLAHPGMGSYLITVGLGTPQQSFLVFIDTGSDVGWVQCLPCLDCYQQADPKFDPSESSSFQQLPCNAAQCSELQIRNCTSTGVCLYGVEYGDSSTTVGEFALETLTVGGQSIPEYAFGCGIYQTEGVPGEFQGGDGLLGLGRGQLSLVSQSVSLFNGRFAYCFPSQSSGSGYIEFGQGTSSNLTPLVSDPQYPSFYFVKVQTITVGNQSLPSVDTSAFTSILIDSGTVITRLPTSIYAAARDAFRSATSSLPAASGPVGDFDTCFVLSSSSTVSIPTLAFHLDNNLVFTVPPASMLYLVDDNDTYCFAFVSTDDSGIIGNYQQRGIRFGFDLQASAVSISDECS